VRLGERQVRTECFLGGDWSRSVPGVGDGAPEDAPALPAWSPVLCKDCWEDGRGGSVCDGASAGSTSEGAGCGRRAWGLGGLDGEGTSLGSEANTPCAGEVTSWCIPPAEPVDAGRARDVLEGADKIGVGWAADWGRDASVCAVALFTAPHICS
jgi:hypothetical protein